MMNTNNNTDILFDDLAVMRSMQLSTTSANDAIQYGDCGNRFEPETASGLKAFITPSPDYSRAIAYGDCGN
jgi:hypothetical protein